MVWDLLRILQLLVPCTQRPPVKQVGFITLSSEGEHMPWGAMACLRKKVLESKYYRICVLRLNDLGVGLWKQAVLVS